MVILRVATIILKLTGLSYDVAYFQARSAFTGTGFTTKESELLVNHPVRRKVVLTLMLVRNVGFVTLVSSLVVSFFNTSGTGILYNFLYLGGGLIIIFLISRFKPIDRLLQFLVEAALKRFTRIYIYDYESLLNLSGEYSVIQYEVGKESWLADACLQELKLTDEGILILGIKRTDGYYIGTPQSETIIYSGDHVILYGKEMNLLEIRDRCKGVDGDKAHEKAALRQKMNEGKALTAVARKAGFIQKLFKRIKP